MTVKEPGWDIRAATSKNGGSDRFTTQFLKNVVS
jgi:hypothetical protein